MLAQDAPPPAVEEPVQESLAPHDAVAQALQPLTEDRLFSDSTVGLHLVDVRTGEEVFSHGGDRAMAPASTMKAITSATALKHLGPSYTFTTQVLYTGELGPDGVLKGDLYIRGTGDPTFVIEDLWKLMVDLKLSGLKEVSGNVYFDDSYMTPERGVPGWTKDSDMENGPAYFPSLGALSLNFNTVAVVARPGPDIGGPAVVVLETEAPGILKTESELVTGAPRTRRRIYMEREVQGASATYKLSGSIPQDSSAQRYYRSVPDAKAYFTAAFAGMARKEGLKVRGKYLEGETPETGAELLHQHRSEPLSRILATTNKHSNNFMAEQVLKALGAELKGEGSTSAGLEVVGDYLVSLGIPAEQFSLVNGSGLSREMRLRPSHLTAVLLDMAADPQVGSEFQASLAIAGRDGTLWSRFREDPGNVGRVRGKTGTLNGVHCLTGFIDAGDGNRYAFAYLVNDLPYSIARARSAHDAFANTLFELSPEDSADAVVSSDP
ncbi:MAG: D-alanyl-D-alanine carboxypeptidase/D-alanyl-D-alanine-endopeptidase [Myxococcota bacterium]|nr:D-alanyl-D-alanine carboxypeptidase/D-alanyl-D-alanine-endopeptidase [Myxococcota bacterium]